MIMHRIRSDIHELSKLINRRGLRSALQEAWLALRFRFSERPNRRFDKQHGVDTCGVIYLNSLSILGDKGIYGIEYDPSPVRLIRWVLNKLDGIIDFDDFAFIDFGSGKGRVLLIASDYPFRQILGVEFASELHDVASKNTNNFRNDSQRCKSLRVVHADATDFEIPDDRCILYFYVPFRPHVMLRIIQNIESSYRANPREMYIVYVKPWFRELLDKQEWTTEIASFRPWWINFSPDPMEVVVYKLNNPRL